jgi:hypothetical protein
MKNVLRFGLIAIVLAQFASCTSNNAIESELFYKSFGLNKTIQSVKVTTYEAKAKFDEVVKGNPLTDLESENYIATFNNDEFVKEMNYFDNEDEEIYSKYIYSYDDKHRVIELKGYDADGKITHKRHNTYGDEEYTMVDLFYFNEKESENKTVYQLDGNYEREWKCYADGELQSMGRNEYNSGKISKKTTFDKDGKVSRYIEYTYSKNCTQVLMHMHKKAIQK